MSIRSSSRRRGLPLALILLCAIFVFAQPAVGDCAGQATGEIGATLPLEDAFRTRVMGLEPPTDLFGKALADPEKVFVRRQGKKGQAVMAAPVPVEAFWIAINDDERHDDTGHVPLRLSRVIEGEEATSGRRTFQYFRRAGIGRWWVNELIMNAELFEESGGRMWELWWNDVMVDFPGETPPVEIDEEVAPLVRGLGAWVLYPIGERCVLVEYATEGEPGGFLGAFQFLVATRAVRTTLTGMLEMARDPVGEDRDVIFVRPDGEPIDGPSP